MKILSHSYFASVLVCVFGLGFGMPALAAATYTWSGGAGDDDWTKGANYEGGVAPVAGDVVEVPDGLTAKVSASDAASWSLASSLARIGLKTDASRLILDVPEGVTNDFAAAVCFSDASWPATKGHLVKTGAGAVNLTRNTSGLQCVYRVHIDVEAGLLSFAKRTVTTYAGVITIAEGAKLETSYAIMWCDALHGTGTLLAKSNFQIRVAGEGTAANLSEIGVWFGNDNVYYCSAGYNRILRNDNVNNYFAVYGSGITEIGSLANKGTACSIGDGGTILYGVGGGGTIRYVGTADVTTDRAVKIEPSDGTASNGRAVFDAGAHGGIAFNGNWSISVDKNWYHPILAAFALTGSNAAPCVISGTIGNSVNTYGINTELGIQKSGSGEWRLMNDGNFFGSSVAVDEGTLGFSSIAEKGDKCALGTAANLRAVTTGIAEPSTFPEAPFAIRLGSAAIGYPADNLATLSARMPKDGVCSTRPVMLGGDARIESVGDGRFRFCGVSALSDGDNRLVLGGETSGNSISGIADGAAGGRIGVVKEGDGIWEMVGTNTFTGPLEVLGGKLILRNSNVYSRYRLVIKDNYGKLPESVTYDYFKLGRVGLFDKDGYRRNIGLQMRGSVIDVPAVLEPGEAGWGMKKSRSYWISNEESGNGLPALMAAGECYDSSCLFFSRGSATDQAGLMDVNDPSTWLTVEMRLTNGCPEIAYYDLAVIYGQAEASGSLSNCNIRAWSLEGSTDGWAWDVLHTVADARSDDPDQILTLPDSNRYWMGQKVTTKWQSAVTKHNTAKLQPIVGHRTGACAPVIGAVDSVTVANGAVLEAEGDVTLSKFKAAYGATAGTVRGAKLAADCEIEVTGIPKGVASFEVPLTFEGAAPEDAEWTVKDGEKVSRRFEAVARDGKLTLVRRGSLIILR